MDHVDSWKFEVTVIYQCNSAKSWNFLDFSYVHPRIVFLPWKGVLMICFSFPKELS